MRTRPRGLALARAFYTEAVRPVAERALGGAPHAAALLRARWGSIRPPG